MNARWTQWLLLFAAAAALCPAAHSQTARVAADGSGDYASIQEAVDALAAGGATPGAIHVAPGVYTGSVSIPSAMSIMGESAEDRPVLVLEPVPGDAQNDGLISTDGVDVTLENLILIPSTDNTPDRAVRLDPVTDNDAFTVTIRNVLVSANDGNDAPLSVDGMEALFPGPDGSVSFNDDGIRVLGGPFGGAGRADVTVNLERTVVTHIDSDRDPTIPTGGLDGFVLGGFNTTLNIGPGVVASYCGRYGFQIITTDTTDTPPDFTPAANFFGTREEPIVCKGNGSVGLQLWTGTHAFDSVQLTENPIGARIDMFSNKLDASRVLATGNETAIAWLNTAGEGVGFAIAESTFFDNQTDYEFSTGYTAESEFTPQPVTLVTEDSVFAGTFLFLFNTDLTLDLEDRVADSFQLVYRNTAFPEEGEYAVIQEFDLYPVTVTLENIVTADPEFLSTDPAGPGYLVVSSGAYAEASTDGSPLGGYFLFDGETAVREWMAFD